jgi:hypothetical protein
MKYRVFYRKNPNPHITYFQNENRWIGCKVFTSLEDAKAFAATVQVESVTDWTGKLVRF